MVMTTHDPLVALMQERFDEAVWQMSEPALQSARFHIAANDRLVRENRLLREEIEKMQGPPPCEEIHVALWLTALVSFCAGALLMWWGLAPKG